MSAGVNLGPNFMESELASVAVPVEPRQPFVWSGDIYDREPMTATTGEVSQEDLNMALDGDHVICAWGPPENPHKYKLLVENDPETISAAAAMNRGLLGTTGSFEIMQFDEMTTLKGLQAFYDGTRPAGGLEM